LTDHLSQNLADQIALTYGDSRVTDAIGAWVSTSDDIEWVLAAPEGLPAEQDLRDAFDALAAHPLAFDTPIYRGTETYFLTSWVTHDEVGTTVHQGFAEVSYFELNATWTAATTDHFLCYKAKSRKGNSCSADAPSNAGGSCEVEENCGGTEDETSFCVPNEFPRGVQVSLSDQFEEGTFDVKKPVSLCTPADKNEEGIIDEETHLEGYQIKLALTDPPQSPHQRQTNIRVRNQFHPEGSELVVDTIKPNRLLVPTAKDLNNPVEAPDNDAHNVDHYKCYKVKVSKGQPKFEPILGVSVDDQFTDGAKLFDLKTPTRLCTPVDKNGEGIKNEATHLMCYRAKPATGQPKHVKVLGIHVNNQFGPAQLDTIKEGELCVPSEKILP
jgi:hypothetical protein